MIDVLWVKGREGGDYFYFFGGCYWYEVYKCLNREIILCKLFRFIIGDLWMYLGSLMLDLL